MAIASSIIAASIAAAATGGTAIAANRSQARAGRRALTYQEQADTRAMDWERQQEEFRRQEAARVAEEEKRRWEAEEANRQQQMQIAEAERLRQAEMDRWNQERLARLDAMSAEDRALEQRRYDEREKRLEPYRQESRAALARLGDLVRNPHAAQSPAAHQFSRPSGMTFRDLTGR